MKLTNVIKTGFVALILSTSVAKADIIVTFDPSTTNVSVGETFTIGVLATTENALTDGFIGFDIGFDFEDTLVNMDSALASAGFLPAIAFNDVAGFSAIPVPVSGIDVLLATLTFTANSVGDLTLDLTAASRFSGLGFVDFSSTALDISVSKVSAPATLGLFAIAGLWLLRVRRQG